MILRKPGKPKYNVPKAYRLIALLNTLAKVLSVIIAKQMMYYAEKHNLLPPNHFSGRVKKNATDVVHLLVHHIKGQWQKEKVVTALFLDIKGAFSNAINEQLIHNLKSRWIPSKIIKYVANMLCDRSTMLRFDDHISKPIKIDNIIGQGDPLSMALYQFYNANLVEIPKEDEGETVAAYVDDAIITASAATFDKAHVKLRDMMTREGKAIGWAKKHNSPFEYNKLTLIDFAHSSRSMERPLLILQSITVNPTKCIKYLGIMLDQNLNWKEKIVYMQEKGSKWAAQICRATRPSWRLMPRAAHRLYIGVAIPRIMYSADVWCIPIHVKNEGDRQKGSVYVICKLTFTQKAGSLAIMEGFHTSPTDALDAYVSTLPLHLKVERIFHQAAV